MVNLANPTAFVELTRRVLPWLAAATLVLFVAGLGLSFAAPPDYQQGETVKIMYLHVPAAWMATFVYGVMVVASLGTLVWRHRLADHQILGRLVEHPASAGLCVPARRADDRALASMAFDRDVARLHLP